MLRYFFPYLQPTPRPGGSKGKGTNDPVHFLPTLPSKRQKPAWQVNPPTFMLSTKPEEEQDKVNGIDLVSELTASKSELHL